MFARFTSAAALAVLLGCAPDAPIAPPASSVSPALTSTAAVAWARIDTREWSTCATSTTGKTACWGRNYLGSLGLGLTGNVYVAAPHWVNTAGRVHGLRTGSFACALQADSTAICWGRSPYGETGSPADSICNPATVSARACNPVPKPISDTRKFRQVSVGFMHACAIDFVGDLYCWGNNANGQLGVGDYSDRSAPTLVAGSNKWMDVSAGDQYTCGVTTGHNVRCWGSNVFAHAGKAADSATFAAPVAVLAGYASKVSAGSSTACALRVSGAVSCWGENANGETGIGFATDTIIWKPQLVTGGHVFRTISVGVGHACAVDASGAGYCWGSNDGNALGDSTVVASCPGNPSGTCSPVPVAVTGSHTWTDLRAGGSVTCGITTTRAAYCFGQGYNGLLGDGAWDDHATPMPVLVPVASP